MLTGGGDRVTFFYSDLQVMDMMGVSPAEWDDLHRWDKLALRYYLIAKAYKEKQAMEKARAESERKSAFKSKLPKQRLR